MEEIKPSMEDWKALYESAIEFKKLGCWDWMYDSDVFGIQNPSNDEIGYCCVMGNLGEFFGLAVYKGIDGFKTYIRVRNGELEPGDPEIIVAQKCLMASYEDREDLTDKDRKIIKDLGLKFRGHNEWPLFRTHDPGYFPWYLNKEQVQYLTLVIQQSMDIASKFKEDKKFLGPRKDNKVPVWIPKKVDSDWVWENKLMNVEIPKGLEYTYAELNADFVDQVKSAIKKRINPWEVDFVISPATVSKKMGERPYYPYMIFVVDAKSGLILHTGFSDLWNHSDDLIDAFTDTIQKLEAFPSEIFVKSQEVYELLKVAAKQLGIKITPKERLPAIESMMSLLMERLF